MYTVSPPTLHHYTSWGCSSGGGGAYSYAGGGGACSYAGGGGGAYSYAETAIDIRLHKCINMCILLLLLLFRWSPFIPSRNLYEVFTYNQMALISLRSCSRVKTSMVLTRSDHSCIHNYISSLLILFNTYFNGPDEA